VAFSKNPIFIYILVNDFMIIFPVKTV